MRTNILGVNIDCVTNTQALERAFNYIEKNERKNKMIITVNPEMVMAAKSDKEIAHIFKKASLVIPDGIGVVLASRLSNIRLPERVAGCDLAHALFGKMKNRGYTAYILGGKKAVCEAAKRNMEHKYPGLKICGCRDGYFNQAGEKEIIDEITRLKPDLLLVGLGFPRQEKWIYSHRDLPVNLSIGVGGTIDIMAGTVKRAPAAFQKMGLEWLYRLIKQPSRLPRMLVLPKFALVVLADAIQSKITGKRGKKL